jgi:hypothetical protein
LAQLLESDGRAPALAGNETEQRGRPGWPPLGSTTGGFGDDQRPIDLQERRGALGGDGGGAETAGHHQIRLPSPARLSAGVFCSLTEHLDAMRQVQRANRLGEEVRPPGAGIQQCPA